MSKIKENNVIIHIGYGKTASTFLQNYFTDMKGINYLGGWYDNKKREYFFKIPFFNKLINQIVQPEFFTGFNKNFKKELANRLKKNRDKVSLISNDHFSITPSYSCAKRLKEIFPNGKILLILRKQQDLIFSLYRYRGHYLRYAAEPYFRRFISFDSWVTRIIKNYYSNSGAHRDKTWEGDYLRVIDSSLLVSNFEKFFGKKNIHILLYEEMVKDPDAFLKKLSTILKIDCSVLKNKLKTNEINKSFSFNHIKFLYYKDKILGKLTITKKIFFLKPLAKIIYKFLGNKSNLFESNFFTKKQLKEIKKIYSKKNNILDKRYNLSLKKYGYFTDIVRNNVPNYDYAGKFSNDNSLYER